MSRRSSLSSFLADSLRRRRQDEADVRDRIYVRPLGRSLAEVRSSPSGATLVVGANRTYRPGAIVPTASNSGFQGETIVASPLVGRRGSQSALSRSIVQPAAASVSSYLAISFADGDNIIYAYLYDNGTYQSQLSSLDLDTHGEPSAVRPAKDPTMDRVVLSGTKLVIWDIQGGSSASYTREGSGGDVVSVCFIWDSKIYYGVNSDTDQDVVNLYELSLNSPTNHPHTLTGTIDGGLFAPTKPLVRGARLNTAGVPMARAYSDGEPSAGDDELWSRASQTVGAAHDLGDYDEDANPGALTPSGWLYFQASYGRGAGSSASDRSVIVADDDGVETYLWPGGWTAGDWSDALKVHVAATSDGSEYAAFREDGLSADGELVRGSVTAQGTGAFPGIPVTAPPSNPRPRYMLPRS